jgi:cobalt-zinc-cadmium efflux system outer membrane protein
MRAFPWAVVSLAAWLCAPVAQGRRITLPEAERLLREQSPEIESAAALIDRAAGERAITRAFPNLVLSYTQDHIPFGARNAYAGSASEPLGAPGARPTRFLVDNNAVATLSWLVEIGKRGPRQEAAAHRLAASRAAAADAVRQRRIELYTAYVELQRLLEERTVVQALLELHRATLRRMPAPRPQTDIFKLRLEIRGLENDLAKLLMEIEVARIGLRRILGLAGLEPVEPVERLEAEHVHAPAPRAEEQIERARQARPDLQALAALEAAALAEVRGARALRIPDLTLQLGYSYDAPNSYLTYGFSLPLPFINRFAGEEARAHADLRRVRAERRAADLRAVAEVLEVLARLRSAGQMVERYHHGYLAQARESLRLARESYAAGKTDGLDLLDTHRTYDAAQREWLRALADYRLSKLRLRAVLGEGAR